MYQYDFTMVDLYRMTIENDREQEYFQYWTVENFQKAIVVLDQAGISMLALRKLQSISQMNLFGRAASSGTRRAAARA
jgi:hypothetical protein